MSLNVETKTFNVKSHLSDEEFLDWKSRLEQILLLSQLRYYKEKKLIAERQIFDSKILGTLCLDEEIPEEIWKNYPPNKKYLISSFGRVKYDNKIVPQKDEEGKTGYLILDDEIFGIKLLKYYTYQMVAVTFLTKLNEGEYHIHHISNNGYDNSVGNLIYLSKDQHKLVHEIENKYRNKWS